MSNTTDSVSEKSFNLVPPTYFDRLIARMELSGYRLFSRVTIDTNDCAYHVPATYARVTRLFFHMPNKKFIIQFVFHENDTEDWRSQYWKIYFYAVFKPLEALLRMTCDGAKDEDPLDTIPHYAKLLEIPGFRHGGGVTNEPYVMRHYEQNATDGAPIASDSLAETVIQISHPVLQYLGYGQFRDLQVTDFPPHYTFPGANNLFWSRFDIEALQRIVKRPWGDDRFRQ